MKQFEIQFTKTITDCPRYITLNADNKTQAQNTFFGMYPSYFITNTKEILIV